jgi:hypothetical protein
VAFQSLSMIHLFEPLNFLQILDFVEVTKKSSFTNPKNNTMKKIYAKALIIIMLVFTTSISIQAQQWMVGDMVDDTLKYLTIIPLEVDSGVSCYDLDTPDGYFAFYTCPDPGIDYGFVIEELTSSDTVEITPTGVVEQGDTVWCTELPLWNIIERKVYFHEADGFIRLRFFAIGEVTEPDIEVPCQPADSLWMQTLTVCNAYYWMNYLCTTVADPLSINDLNLEDLGISYPSSGNSYVLSLSSSEEISRMLIYDMQGKIVAYSSSMSSINCNALNAGSYVVAIELDNGSLLREKFILNK